MYLNLKNAIVIFFSELSKSSSHKHDESNDTKYQDKKHHNEELSHSHSLENMIIYIVLLSGMLTFHVIDTVFGVDQIANESNSHDHHTNNNDNK